MLLAVNMLALVSLSVLKMYMTEYMFLSTENETNILMHAVSIAKRVFSLGEYDYGFNIKQAILVNYGDYGLGLPLVIWLILRDSPMWTILVMGLIIVIIIYLYLSYVANLRNTNLLSPTNMLKTTALGLLVFGLGYAIFLTNNNLSLTVIGTHSRHNLTAALGVSLSIVGGIGFISTILPRDKWRKRFFCVLVATLCTSGFIIVNTLASFWITAYRHQVKILEDIRQHILTMPIGSTLILDGICSNVGPAIVFNSSWDLAGALQMLYGDSNLRADVVSPYLKVREEGIYTSLNLPETKYPYDQLFVYNLDKRTTYKITDANVARTYFQTSVMNHKNYWEHECLNQKGKGLDAPIF
jgi:hypothetical protein